MHDSDAKLLESWVTRRDAEAMTAIIRRHSGLVYGTCVRILRNHADAQDATQECFLKLANVRSSGDSVPALLHRMATNQCLNEIRGNRRRRERESKYGEAVEQTTEPTWDDIQVYVDEAIDALPDTLRDVVLRSYFEGETHEAIAHAEGVSRAAISLRAKKGIEAIRGNLERRGVMVGGASLAALVTANGAHAAPEGLVTELTKLAIAGPMNAPGRTRGNQLFRRPAAYLVAACVVLAVPITISNISTNMNSPGSPAPPEPIPVREAAPVGVSSTFESRPGQPDPANYLNVEDAHDMSDHDSEPAVPPSESSKPESLPRR